MQTSKRRRKGAKHRRRRLQKRFCRRFYYRFSYLRGRWTSRFYPTPSRRYQSGGAGVSSLSREPLVPPEGLSVEPPEDSSLPLEPPTYLIVSVFKTHLQFIHSVCLEPFSAGVAALSIIHSLSWCLSLSVFTCSVKILSQFLHFSPSDKPYSVHVAFLPVTVIFLCFFLQLRCL